MKSKNRLKKRKQFNWIFKNGKTVHSKNLALVFHESHGKDYKVGFSVTKKVGKAVVRNKVKRRLREIVTAFRKNILPRSTLIFVAKQTANECDFWTLKDEVLELLKKSKLYKETNS